MNISINFDDLQVVMGNRTLQVSSFCTTGIFFKKPGKSHIKLS